MLILIPAVFLTDLLLLAVVAGLVAIAPTKRVRKLAWVTLVYVCCEALFHVYMERGAAAIMARF